MNIDRRHLLAGAFILSTAPAAAQAERKPAAEADPYAAAVARGVAYFRRRNAEQKPLVAALTRALLGGDRAASMAAYVASRAPYEEIEVLAADFEQIDKDIDSRAYAHGQGESDPEFKGFHKIEALLFGDGDLAAAARYSSELEASVAALDTALEERERFSAASSFNGMIALATEIGAKKISGEEETWSDRSLLIFRHNLVGIRSQYSPFEAALKARKEAVAAEVARGFDAAQAVVDSLYGTEPGGRAFSGIGVMDRRAIVKATLSLRDGLAASRETLGLAG